MTVRLDEFDQFEWWDVARKVDPDMTWERFERDWDEFVRLKRKGHMAWHRSQVSRPRSR